MDDHSQPFNQELSKEIYDEISRLNKEGTEASRIRLSKLDADIKYWQEWRKEHESSNKSDLVSARHGIKLIAEDLIPRQNEKINVAINYSQDAVRCTAEANKAAQKAVVVLEEGRKDNKRFIRGFLVSIFLLVMATIFSQTMKLIQDSGNQKQTVEYLEMLTKQLQRSMPIKK